MNTLLLPIVGNLTSNPELRFTPAGVAVCRFTVAHNPRTFDRATEQWRDGEPTFFTCSAWRHLGENLAGSLKAGMRVVLVGTLRTQRWDSDGRGKTPAGQKIESLTVDVMAGGPELTFATAAVEKAVRSRAGEVAPDDPWAGASRTRPVGDAGGFDDEPPF